jgi:hypothetical protein
MACNKDPQIEEVYFAFEMPFTITPGTDTVRVGDTLRMEANFSDTLFDVRSQRKYDLDCFTFPAFMAVRELVNSREGFNTQKSATDAFHFLFGNDNGGVTGGTFANVALKCINGRYVFELKIVPKRNGVFSFAIMDVEAGYIQLPSTLAPSFPGFKRIPIVIINKYVFNDGATHYKTFSQHALPALPEANGERWEELRNYTIVVR